MTDRGVANATRALPQPLDHALAQLRRRRVLLVPGEPGTVPEGGKRYPVALTRSLLGRLPGSPALRAALGTAPGRAVFQGHAWLGADARPRLAVDGLGGVWRLALPGKRGTYETLRELRAPRDLRPVSSRAVEVAPGIVERRHRIPLRYHPGAWLVVAVTVHRSGHPRYDAWVWHPDRRGASALWWDEARRVIELFRDLAGSWFWVGPPPAPSTPVSASASADGASNGAVTGGHGDA